jgi:hypothetical protein
MTIDFRGPFFKWSLVHERLRELAAALPHCHTWPTASRFGSQDVLGKLDAIVSGSEA